MFVICPFVFFPCRTIFPWNVRVSTRQRGAKTLRKMTPAHHRFINLSKQSGYDGMKEGKSRSESEDENEQGAGTREIIQKQTMAMVWYGLYDSRSFDPSRNPRVSCNLVNQNYVGFFPKG